MKLARPLSRTLFALPLMAVLAGCGDSNPIQPVAVVPAEPLPALTPVPSPAPVAAPKSVCAAYTGPAMSSLNAYEGITHAHSSYSDGDPTTNPSDYYRIGKAHGYDFFASSEHSDGVDNGAYISLHATCDATSSKFDPTALQYCFANPSIDKLAKWVSMLDFAKAATTSQFLAINGFEWTSDVFGHINVYFSKNFTNAKTDGGYAATMNTFWDWFTRAPGTPGDGGSPSSPTPFGGGGDALAHFNHPHDKCQLKNDPTGSATGFCDWNDYTLIPAAHDRMFGIEVFNDSDQQDRYNPFFMRALDKGWHLSPVGSEDEHFGDYASEKFPKTVTLGTALNEKGFREAWMARRTYAITPGNHVRVSMTADGAHPMGSRLSCDMGKTVPLDVAVTSKTGDALVSEYRLLTNTGKLLATVKGTTAHFDLAVPATNATVPESWYLVRAYKPDGKALATMAPVWIKGR